MSEVTTRKSLKRKRSEKYALIKLNDNKLIVPSDSVEIERGHCFYIVGIIRLPCQLLYDNETKENLQELEKESSLMEESFVSLENSITLSQDEAALSDKILQKSKKSKYNDSSNDLDYEPSENEEGDTSGSINNSLTKKDETNNTKSNEDIVITLNKVYEVETSADGNKAYFCPYCLKDVKKFARHLEDVHSKEVKERYEQEVYDAFSNPKFSKERNDEITKIRNKGILLYNSKFEYHKGKLRSSKRLNENFEVTSKELTICDDCNGTYTVKSIRFHKCVSRPENEAKSGKKVFQQRGRSRFLHSTQRILENNDPEETRLRKTLIPSIKNKELREIISNDKLMLQTSVTLCKQHPLDRHDYIITQKLRSLAKLVKYMKDQNKKITSLSTALNSSNYKLICKAIKKIAGYNYSKVDPKYEHPNTATAMTNLINEAIHLYELEALQWKDGLDKDQTLKQIDRLRQTCKLGFRGDINKEANNNYTENKLNQEKRTVNEKDLNKLLIYATKQRDEALESMLVLNKAGKFDRDVFRNLQESSIVLVTVKNFKRAGESQILKIRDYKRIVQIDENHPSWNTLSKKEQLQSKKYGRFESIGKLYNPVVFLLDKKMKETFDVLVDPKFRLKAGIPVDNPYIYAIIGNTEKFSYIKSCDIIRNYADNCGAQDPESLRTRSLRRYFATRVMNDNKSSQQDRKSASDFLSHGLGIHKTVYEDRTVNDVVHASRHIEKFTASSSNKSVARKKSKSNGILMKKSLKKSYKEEESDEEEEADKENDTNENSYENEKEDQDKESDKSDEDDEQVEYDEDEEDEDGTEDTDYKLANSVASVKSKKTRYSDDQWRVLCKYFHFHIQIKKVPTNAAMREAKNKIMFLKDKNLNTLRTLLTRIINNPKKFQKYFPKKYK